MSALGHKRTFALQNVMSQMRHMECPLWANSGYWSPSLDHLVGARKHGRGDGEADRFGGLEVDDQLVFGWRLHRHISRLLTLENAIDVAGRAPELVEEIRPIGDQTAVTNEES